MIKKILIIILYLAFVSFNLYAKENASGKARRLYEEALIMGRAENIKGAMIKLKEAAELEPNFAATLESFLKDYPNDPQVLHMLGGVYFALGENKKAIATWERIKGIDEIIYLTRKKWIEEMRGLSSMTNKGETGDHY